MQKLEFSEAEIEDVCNQLRIPQNTFADKNGDRRKILECWDNANIIACPGSGKTTVLLAKLLLLAKRMPFKDGKGICVLTHTNVAIDEIKTKLNSSSKVLTEYPNFFGTYQAFIGRFILNKALSDGFSSRAITVDDDIFFKKLSAKYVDSARWGNPNSDDKSLKRFIFNRAYSGTITLKQIKESILPTEKNNVAAKEIYDLLKSAGYISRKGDLIYKKCSKINVIDLTSFKPHDVAIKSFIELKHSDVMQNIESNTRSMATSFWIDRVEGKIYANHSDLKSGRKSLAGSTTPTFIALNRLHEELYKLGYVGFDHAFELCRSYAVKNDRLHALFSKRFSFLFCDEMQDSQKHQMDLIDSLFTDKVVRQAYGDPDQAIYSSANSGASAWKRSEHDFKTLSISESKRFGNKISQCLNPFKKELANITGNEKIESERPCIILYDDPSEVLPLFVAEIGKRKLVETSDYKNWHHASAPFNAVGLVGKQSENITIQSYSGDYTKYSNSKKTEFSNLISYFQKRSNIEVRQNGTRIYFDLFINAFIRTLAEAEVRHTKSTLLQKLSENEEFLRSFRLAAFKWIGMIEKNDTDARSIRDEFIKVMKDWVHQPFQTSFFSDDSIIPIGQVQKEPNIYLEDNINVKLGTIHSVKGETHIATLLLDTQNYNDFESNIFFKGKCGKLFCGEAYKPPSKSYERLEYRLKTTYVAMSRPTRLLCVALKKENADCPKCTGKIKEDCNWEIIFSSK